MRSIVAWSNQPCLFSLFCGYVGSLSGWKLFDEEEVEKSFYPDFILMGTNQNFSDPLIVLLWPQETSFWFPKVLSKYSLLLILLSISSQFVKMQNLYISINTD